MEIRHYMVIRILLMVAKIAAPEATLRAEIDKLINHFNWHEPIKSAGNPRKDTPGDGE